MLCGAFCTATLVERGVAGMTVVFGTFEWDSNKARANIIKHGISFEEAIEVFRDPYFFEIPDAKHSTLDEARFLGYGMTRRCVVVTTVFVERKKVRIISARRATTQEEEDYYERRFG